MADDLAINAVVGWLPGGELPHDHTKAEDIGLLRIFEALDNFRSHPLVRTNLGCHDLRFNPRPAEISELRRQGVVKQNVQTLQVSMQDRLLARVQVVDAFRDVEGKLFPVVPGHLDLHVMEQAPK